MAVRYYDVWSGRQLAEVPPGCWRLDDGSAPGYVVGPALFDPQINGFAGVDFQSPDVTAGQLEHAARMLRRCGCAHFLITLITAEAGFLRDQLARLGELLKTSRWLTEAVVGFHLEGPFISAEDGYRGAHPVEHVRPADPDLFECWQRAAGGRIRLVTVAPECAGVLAVIPRLVAGGVLVSLGHTAADAAALGSAVAAGARLFTHLGNAMPCEVHRSDNLIQRVLAIPELSVSLIPDGLHLPPPALGNMVRLLGPGRVLMTTDAASPAGAGPGKYRFGELDIEVGPDGMVRLPGTDLLAGSSLTPLAGLYNGVRFGGLGADGAWRAWTRLRTLICPRLRPPMLMVPWGCGVAETDPSGG